MADTGGLNPPAATHAGSSPASGTKEDMMQIVRECLGWLLIGYLLGMLGYPMYEVWKMEVEEEPRLERVITKHEAWRMRR